MYYENFDCLISRTAEGYEMRVLDSPAGHRKCPIHYPFSDLEIENLILKVSRTRRKRYHIESPELEAAQAFGERLYRTFFKEAVGECLERSLHEVRRLEAGLRVRLRLTDTPELLNLPWEYLYFLPSDKFFCLSDYTSLTRFLDIQQMLLPLRVEPPLRILVMVSEPHDAPELDAEQEWANLTTALQDLVNCGLFEVDRLSAATLHGLRAHLREKEYHVFHFIGHGGFRETAGESYVLLEGENKYKHLVAAEHLAAVLNNEPTLRLVILNACEGARSSCHDPFAGTAQKLLQQGIPAVLAMQFAISDGAAISFTKQFYSKLANGQSLDRALAETRQALYDDEYRLEWATPVLYLRTRESVLFKVEPQSGVPRIPSIPAPTPDAFTRLLNIQVRISVLHYLSNQATPAKGLSITEIARDLGIRRRKILVAVLYELLQEGLIDRITVHKNAFWKISEVGNEMVSKLQEAMGASVALVRK